MSFFRRLFGARSREQTSSPKPASEPPIGTKTRATEVVDEPDLHPLLFLARSPAPKEDDVLVAIARLRNEAAAGGVLTELLRRGDDARLSERARFDVASLFRERGDIALARRVIERDDGDDALFLSAELAHEEGDVAHALGCIERLLARNIDHPGALERRKHYAEKLGFSKGASPLPTGATLFAPSGEVPFTLVREIARGGGGVVYEARDRALGRRVALKFYHDPKGQRAQLLREARVSSELVGPSVVRVFDAEPTRGWIALEWAEGGSLREALSRGGFDANEAWRVVHELARALAFVHERGWVHLDVKPGNVLLMERRRVVLSDFGIAGRVGEAADGGSLGFVSDERVRGKLAEPRDDLYGFGKILLELARSLPDEDRPLRELAESCIGGELVDGSDVVTRIGSAPRTRLTTRDAT